MSIIGSGHALLLASAAPAAAVTGVSRSLRFNSADSAYLSRTPASAGNRKTWTWSGWIKRSKLGINARLFDAYTAQSDTGYLLCGFSTADKLIISGWATNWKITSQVFRDPSAWFHLVVAFDSTQATGTDRIKFYVNGAQVTAFDTDTAPAQNTDHAINGAWAHAIGRYSPSPAQYFDGYLADVHFVDGQALSPSDFAETDATTGQWVPKAYSGSYGTNGFHLTFSDNSGTSSTTLGKDAAGSNNWTPNNFSVASGSGNDSLVDVPQNGDQTDTGAGGEVRGNYCTMNPLKKGSTDIALSNGNLDGTRPSTGTAEVVLGTIGMTTGKWYWEMVWTSGTFAALGIATDAIDLDDNIYGPNGWAYQSNGRKGANSSTSSYGATFAIGDVIAVAFNADNGQLTFYKNNTSQGVAFTVTAGVTYFPSFGIDSMTGWSVNFGQRPFAYTAPSGFKALCTTNLPTPTIADGSAYMDVVTYTGNSSTNTISGLGFSPDFVWTKPRTNAGWHFLSDIIRGGTKALASNDTSSEITRPNHIQSWNSDGFTLGADGTSNDLNTPAVAWTWDAGSSTVSNTDGSITSSVRANASAGFSIVSWTGTSSSGTIGHGLNDAPAMIIVKCRSTGGTGWPVYHQSLGGVDKVITLQSTAAVQTISNYWNTTAPSSTTFGVASGYDNNVNGATMIAYCFAPVAGYSAFGSYTGNGNTTGDGAFVYLGFRPRWIMIRGTGTDSWIIHDAARNTYNFVGNRLWANFADQEASSTVFGIDMLSNGFKTRVNNADQGGWNASGQTYIYACFAESPFKFANAR